jgi:hypothetical protein
MRVEERERERERERKRKRERENDRVEWEIRRAGGIREGNVERERRE